MRVWLGPNSSKTVWLVPLVLGASGLQHPRLFWILGQPQVNSIDQHDTHQIHVTKNKIPKHGTFLSDPNTIPVSWTHHNGLPTIWKQKGFTSDYGKDFSRTSESILRHSFTNALNTQHSKWGFLWSATNFIQLTSA